MRLLLGFLFFFFSGIAINSVSAQQQTKVKTLVVKAKKVAALDSSNVAVRKIDEQAVSTYSKQKEFIYDDVAPAKMSIIDRFWRWFWSKVMSLFSDPVSGGLLKVLLIGGLIALIIFAAFKLVGVDFKVLLGRSKTVEVPFEETLENIHHIDFDQQLAQALIDGNYRMAVRLLYLRTLKNLTDHNLIDWKLEKTNQTYVGELTEFNKRVEFNKLTNQFEYIWYGEFFIDKRGFNKIEESFQQFNQQVG